MFCGILRTSTQPQNSFTNSFLFWVLFAVLIINVGYIITNNNNNNDNNNNNNNKYIVL
jgi:hypothetical protein